MQMRYGKGGWVQVREPDSATVVYLRIEADGGLGAFVLDGGGAEVSQRKLTAVAAKLVGYVARANARPDILRLMRGSLVEEQDPLSAFDDAGFGWMGPVQPLERVTLALPVDGITEAFLDQVAAAYKSALMHNERPNVALAQQSGAPKKTVESWVYMARKVGKLPKTTKGSAR